MLASGVRPEAGRDELRAPGWIHADGSGRNIRRRQKLFI
jgi:hypothetical protein